MTYAVYNVTDHTQLSIRGTTGTHPYSKFVFGIYIGTAELEGDPTMPNMSAYDDMEWSEAVKMAYWILEQDKWIKEDSNRRTEE